MGSSVTLRSDLDGSNHQSEGLVAFDLTNRDEASVPVSDAHELTYRIPAAGLPQRDALSGEQLAAQWLGEADQRQMGEHRERFDVGRRLAPSQSGDERV
jgi:hypothetical protein